MTSAIGDRGFTLLELLVTLTILVLVAAAWPLAAPKIFPRQQLRNEAQQFIAAARLARSTARLTGEAQVLAVLPQEDGYSVGDDSRHLGRGTRMRILGLEGRPEISAIHFYADGSASAGLVEFRLEEKSEHILVGSLTGRAEPVP